MENCKGDRLKTRGGSVTKELDMSKHFPSDIIV